ncbi:MAG: hypothetical protein J5J00_10215 [Deltaproteobacteria bacterium]|nr:hypothetical protein [Deltaproteobacteria bacterium]
MRKNLFSGPDDFSLSPLLTLLPVKGKLSRLDSLTSSLFARYEKVSGILKENPVGAAPESKRRFLAEEAMLKQVLDWLEVKPGS